jgi:hypothetical protein
MVLGVLLADAVVGAVAKNKEVGRVLDILSALRAKAVRVKLVRVLIALVGNRMKKM